MEKRGPAPLIAPIALTRLLRIGLDSRTHAVGFLEVRTGTVLGWEELEDYQLLDIPAFMACLAVPDGVTVTSGGCRIYKCSLLHKFALVFVTLSGEANEANEMKLDEMKKTIERHFYNAINSTRHH